MSKKTASSFSPISPQSNGRPAIRPSAVPKKSATKHPGSKKVLVTGGAGFIGSNLCRSLLDDGYTVLAVDNFITGQADHVRMLRQYPNFFFFELDIIHPSFIKKFTPIPVEAIFHLACPTGVPNLERLSMEMLETCSIGTMNVLHLAKLHQAKLLFTSTCEVYGQPQVSPQPESYVGHVDPVGPRSPYEEGKRFAETLIIAFAKKYNLDAKIARLFNVYGPGMDLNDLRVIPQFLKSIETDDELRIYGDGLQKRTLIYIDDMIQGLRTIFSKGQPREIYNIGGRHPITIHGLAKHILRISKRRNGITFHPHFIEDHHHRQPRLTKIKKLGWSPTTSLDAGLRRMIASRFNGGIS